MEKDLPALSKEQRKAEWSRRISECRSSSLTVREWCKQHGINEKTYYYWQHRIWKSLKKAQGSQFVPVPALPEAGQRLAARIHIGGAEAEIYAGADETVVETICRSLKQC